MEATECKVGQRIRSNAGDYATVHHLEDRGVFSPPLVYIWREDGENPNDVRQITPNFWNACSESDREGSSKSAITSYLGLGIGSGQAELTIFRGKKGYGDYDGAFERRETVSLSSPYRRTLREYISKLARDGQLLSGEKFSATALFWDGDVQTETFTVSTPEPAPPQPEVEFEERD